MFKRTVDVDEVRNGEVIRGSIIWMECDGFWHLLRWLDAKFPTRES